MTAAPVYDELNRLADKRLHASNYDGITPVALGASFNYLQSLDYTYNIRGWLTGINNPASCALQGGDQLADLFNMGLDYESTANGATAQFNGNIAAMQWRTNVNGSCLTRQQYRFTYDYANRLLTANHFTHNGTAWVNTNNYSESNIAYDLNGNIKTYTRRGLTAPATFGIIDQLTYTYGDAARPDRLTNVSDAGSAAKGFKFTSGAAAYTYDLNGNLTQDNHKSLSFQYNYLNLPNYITNPGGSEITITYTADGEKLSKTSPTETRNYVSGIEYLGNALDAIYHGEGRCTPNGATAFYYEYTIKDHLGNARINFRANGAAVTFLQELHYYPFGMLMEGIGTAQVTNNGYKYNGKELNEDLGLNLHDYGARWYDASLGRWWSVDPMGGKYQPWSGYNYALGNPMKFVDPNGMEVVENGDNTTFTGDDAVNQFARLKRLYGSDENAKEDKSEVNENSRTTEGPGDKFKSPDAAAKDWAATYNHESIADNKERSSAIYKIKDSKGNVLYAYTPAVTGAGASAPDVETTPPGTQRIADIHSHAAYDVKYDNNNFSPNDKIDNKFDNELGYVVTPSGSIQKYDPKTGTITIVATNAPSDLNDPTAPQPPKLNTPPIINFSINHE
ncbi:MAG TPA: DUF4329 domain-containing protein [Saprospiraceae bacterium]|nr:DUF4329 domain-containing protein [Saprospiraceae bacterium]